MTGHGSSTILQVSLVCPERAQFQVEACPQVRLSGSGDTWFTGVQRVQVLSFLLSQRGITGDVVVPEDMRRSPLFHETNSGLRDQERGSGEIVKLPKEGDSLKVVEPAILWVPIMDEVKGTFHWIKISEGYRFLNQELLSK